ncbi:MAG TPA: M2 family metallopeptidase [Candidatus Binatia bacterium]|nr:M2 family metallopeptidase [Candidatus Binatia bacterium]
MNAQTATPVQPQTSPQSQPTVAEGEEFMRAAEARLNDLTVKANRASWVQGNFITDDTQMMSAQANEALIGATTLLAKQATRFDHLRLPPELARKMLLLKLSAAVPAPAPSDPKELAEMARIGTSLEADYGKGKYCPKSGKHAGECLDIGAIERIMETSTDPDELQGLWAGWHTISPPMRERYARWVELGNKGAREMGFSDLGAMWRAGYDMTPEQFSAEVERLWQQVKPLYESLHAYVRGRLVEKYGSLAVDANGMIRADLLGGPWAQEWGNIFALVAPPQQKPQYDLTELLKAKNVDAIGMVKYGEGFFTSLGFAPLPGTFWERSLFVKPRDRDVVSHASAWDIDNFDDLRLKMCIQIRGEDFITVHHELGHNIYQRAYEHQPFLFKNGANDGFHEAIGDSIALSITPEYLNRVGLLPVIPQSDDTAYLLRMALDKVAFLPFGLLIDQWRWKVFSGEIRPADYNRTWWEMREKYQGVAPPVARSEADFDPGAKYHVPSNVPYTRYFLARILQFQFYRAMCREAGFTGPLYRCSFYGNKAAGAKLNAMLEMGQSKPWPDALYVLTGERQMDAGAMMEYFAPLKQWLDEQNRGKQLGWKSGRQQKPSL